MHAPYVLEVGKLPVCDVRDGTPQQKHACGRFAVGGTDGTEVDAHKIKVPSTDPDMVAEGVGKLVPMGRPSIPFLNVCEKHVNWPHSEDAAKFAATEEYKSRAAALKK